MAVRGSVTLLFFLLNGIVHADDLLTSPLPATAEPSTSTLPPDMQATTAPPTTSERSSATTLAGVIAVSSSTTQSSTTYSTTGRPTTTESSTTSSTTGPTTTESSTTNSTTGPTTTESSTTNSTTGPTTTESSTTNSTTGPPTTTPHNTTNSTTEAPTTPYTNATTVPTPPPTTPHPTTPHPTTPPVPKPTVGNYNVKSDNVSICLLAKMGLQFSFKKDGNSSLQTLNLDPSPNVTEVNGTCGNGRDSFLELKSKEVTVNFVFTNVSQKFRLDSLTFIVHHENVTIFNESKSNLSLWEASLGSSYMCRKEQTYNITDLLAVKTFELQVQPFAVQKNMFGTAHECSMDDTSLLIPIIVGAALAGLIFIVVIAYVIGRRRTYVGYQTL